MYKTFNETEIKAFETSFNDLLKLAKEKSTAKHILGHYKQGICPYMQFIKFDALNPQDWPNNIAENSVFVTFCIDYQSKKVELHNTGHIWLSPKDKQDERLKYYAMRGMHNIAKEDYGVKKFRKQGFKDLKDLYNKMENYYKAVMTAIKDYTGGYPYKEGIILPTEENAA